jgi:hypothetical protein
MKVPHIDHVMYDGSEWFSYPRRRDSAWPEMDLEYPESDLPIHRYLSSASGSEIGPFLQTWLLFGLLSEFFGGNALKESGTVLTTTDGAVDEKVPNEVVCRIYENYTREDDGDRYITTTTLLQDMEDAVKCGMLDRDHFLSSCLRLRQCLKMAYVVLSAAPQDLDRSVRTSIGVIGELLSRSINSALFDFKLPGNCIPGWAKTIIGHHATPQQDNGLPIKREVMLSHGWCLSDISRAKDKFDSLHALHFLGMMNRSFPSRDHSNCDHLNCAAYQINKDYEVRHVQPDCSCQIVHIDNSIVVDILKQEKTIPLLRFTGGVDDLRIEIVRSCLDTPYVAISHVRQVIAFT